MAAEGGSGGYYYSSSKKTDDICEDVCGPVIFFLQYLQICPLFEFFCKFWDLIDFDEYRLIVLSVESIKLGSFEGSRPIMGIDCFDRV